MLGARAVGAELISEYPNPCRDAGHFPAGEAALAAGRARETNRARHGQCRGWPTCGPWGISCKGSVPSTSRNAIPSLSSCANPLSLAGGEGPLRLGGAKSFSPYAQASRASGRAKRFKPRPQAPSLPRPGKGRDLTPLGFLTNPPPTEATAACSGRRPAASRTRARDRFRGTRERTDLEDLHGTRFGWPKLRGRVPIRPSCKNESK